MKDTDVWILNTTAGKHLHISANISLKTLTTFRKPVLLNIGSTLAHKLSKKSVSKLAKEKWNVFTRYAWGTSFVIGIVWREEGKASIAFWEVQNPPGTLQVTQPWSETWPEARHILFSAYNKDLTGTTAVKWKVLKDIVFQDTEYETL